MSQRLIPLLISKCFVRKFFGIFLLLLGFTFQPADSQISEPLKTADVVRLELNKPIGREIDDRQTHGYQISLPANQFVKVIIEQRGVDVETELFGPDNKSVTNFNSEIRIRENDEVKFVSGPEGVYHLEVKAKYKNAAASYEIRLTEIREATEHDRLLYQALMLSREATAMEYAGKYNEAVPLVTEALEISRKESGAEKDNADIAYLLDQLGYLQRQKGNYDLAESLTRQGFTMNEKVLGLEHPQTAFSLHHLGSVYFSKNENVQANQMWQQALAITEKVLGPDHPRTMSILVSLSTYLSDNGDLAQAERLLLRALGIAEKSFGPDNVLTANILNNLGNVYREKDDNERAEQFFQRALTTYEKTIGTENNIYSNTLQNLGIIFREKKDYDRALELYERALTIREKQLGPEHPNVAALLNNISNIYRSKGDYAKALEIQQRVLSIAEKSVGFYHGLTLLSLSNISRIYMAEGDTAQALIFQTRLEDRTETGMALDLTIGSERQKLAYLETIAEENDRTISLHANLMPDNRKAGALAALVLLQRKGRVLDAMSESLSALRQRFNPEDQKLLDQLQSVTAQLAKFALSKPPKMPPDEYQKQLSVLENQKDKLEAEISRRSAEFKTQTQPVTLASIQTRIPPNAALIEFAVYHPFNPKAASNNDAYDEPHYIAYILHHEGDVEWQELGPAQPIDAAISAFRQAVRDPNRKDVQQLARVVDEKIMQPLKNMLGKAAQLLISPDGNLNLIPFEALVDGQGKYRIENYSFTYLTSGRDLLRMQTLGESKSKPLIIANPSFGELTSTGQPANSETLKINRNKRQSITATRNLSDTYFAPLDGTAEEARLIQSIYPDANFLTGNQATETAIKQAVAPKILHIATHGFFLQDIEAAKQESENPLLRSGLALAGANRRAQTGDDGILTALEASGLNLSGTKLVVLSACDTGLGEIKNGEGVYGLRRAFILAGTESLVMSLWPVSDYATRELMTKYYRNLKQGLGRGAALRRVQLEMLKRTDGNHPFYWASFIQSGEWANLDGQR